MYFFHTLHRSASVDLTACLEDPGGKPVQFPAAFIYKSAVLSCAKGLPCRGYKEQLAVLLQLESPSPHTGCCTTPVHTQG